MRPARSRRPGIDLLNARDETLNSGRCRRGRRTDVHLSVIGVRVTDKAATRDDFEQFSRVQQEQQRAKDRALRLYLGNGAR